MSLKELVGGEVVVTVRLPMAKGMRIGVAVVLACLVGLSGGCALARQAKRRPGTNVVVLQTGGTKVRGELVGVRPEGLVLDTKNGPAAVPKSEIECLWTKKGIQNGRGPVLTPGTWFNLVWRLLVEKKAS